MDKKNTHEKKERNEEIKILFDKKVSISDIANQFSISKVRVHQIVRALKIKKNRELRERNTKINKLYDERHTQKEIAEVVGISRARVQQILNLKEANSNE